MAEYIKKSEALDVLKPLPADNLGDPFNLGINYARRQIDTIPAADVEEVRHSHWEFPIFTDSDDGLDPRVKCSECGGIEAAFARWKYCPNCGAKMAED